MDDIIHLLPDSVANQIAAGEVVQRPSSIIKEMVENSIDAGATHIQVYVTDGGKTNVQIIDDGKGMSETDARLAFERHATSKIKSAADLFKLTTMGFRGEALASIAAVAQVELRTRRPEDELGTLITISGAKVENQEPVACPVGSNFSVRNLFFNVPARRKFLKSNQTEMNNIVADFQRIVLVYPEISFTLSNNGVEMLNLPKSSIRQRIVNVFGKKINSELLPVDVETSLVTISGYVGKPESARKKCAQQYFFVNGRYMRHPGFHAAVMRAFDGLIHTGEQIPYFIYLSVDPSSIDVNVHPTKTEIKFDNESAIWQVLSAVVRESVGKFSNVPLIDFDTEGRPDIPVPGTGGTLPNQPEPITTSYNPFASQPSYNKRTDGWEKLYQSKGGRAGAQSRGTDYSFDDLIPSGIGTVGGNDSQDEGLLPSGVNASAVLPGQTSALEMFDGIEPSTLNLWHGDEVANPPVPYDSTLPKFQYKGRYIIYPQPEGLYAVDQHRAHVRVLYEQNLSSMGNHPRPTQKVLFPEIVQFSMAEAAVLEDSLADLTALGFELTSLGGGSYSVSGVPAGFEGVNVNSLLREMIAMLMEHAVELRSEVQQQLALSMAKASAIDYGQVLSNVEMDKLLTELFATTSPARTPEGKVIYAVIDTKTIDKMF